MSRKGDSRGEAPAVATRARPRRQPARAPLPERGWQGSIAGIRGLLERCEGHVMASLDAVIHALKQMTGRRRGSRSA